eukprot:scaffold24184_cov196-Skeletonema_dohrnii-CCMP3373.AAC.1
MNLVRKYMLHALVMFYARHSLYKPTCCLTEQDKSRAQPHHPSECVTYPTFNANSSTTMQSIISGPQRHPITRFAYRKAIVPSSERRGSDKLTNCVVVILVETPHTAASGSHGDRVIIHGIMDGDYNTFYEGQQSVCPSIPHRI